MRERERERGTLVRAAARSLADELLHAPHEKVASLHTREREGGRERERERERDKEREGERDPTAP